MSGTHQSEPVTGVLFTAVNHSRTVIVTVTRRGYHQGNIDINMARPSQDQVLRATRHSSGLSTRFGPRTPSFMDFQFGLTAGYSDGYAGREFRAISTLRQVRCPTRFHLPQLKVRSSLFDRGLIFGYEDGFGQMPAKTTEKIPERPSGTGSCQKAKGEDDWRPARHRITAKAIEGGLILGHKDAFAAHGEHGLLEASSNPSAEHLNLRSLSRDMYSA